MQTETMPAVPSTALFGSLPPVLDMCCGPRMMWFDKRDPRATFLDRRKERHAINRPLRNTVEWTETDPDIIGDFRELPFDDETFWHVVFDPPHFERDNPGSFMAKKYGTLNGEWREMLLRGFAEGFRVLKPGGTLIFKWTATENPVSEILKLTPMQPLYGHKSGKQAQTHWIAFFKPNAEVRHGAKDADLD
jgi:SAM-dependent methyltransferase